MVLPLVLGGGALLAGLYTGRSFFDDYMQRRQQQGQAAGFREAVAQAQVGTGQEAPRGDPGMVGPMPEETTTDLGMLGQALLDQGQPGGLDFVAQAAQNRAAATGQQRQDERDFMQAIYLQNLKARQQAELERIKAQTNATNATAPFKMTAGFWSELNSQAAGLGRLGGIIGRFRELMSQGGTVPWGDIAGEVESLRTEAMSALTLAEGQGVIREGERELWEQRIPDPASITDKLIGGEAGKLEALTQLYNDRVQAYMNAARMTTGLPTLQQLPSRLNIPPGLRRVREDELGQETEDAPVATLQRTRVPPPVQGPVLPPVQGPEAPPPTRRPRGPRG